MMGLMETEEHLNLMTHNLRFEGEIPLAPKVSAAVDGVELVVTILDLEEVEMAFDLSREHVEGLTVLLREVVVLENVGKVQQVVGHWMLVEEALMDH